LTTDFLLGGVLIKAPFNGAAARLQALERADALLSHYLTTCEKLRVLNDSDVTAWRRLESGEAPFAPEQAREQKIARFKAQRASEKRLQEITSALRAAADTSAAAASSSSSSGSSTTVSRQSDEAAAAHREGLSRESHTLQLESYAREALDELSNLSREKAMLVQMVTAESNRRDSSSSGAAHDDRVRQSVHSQQGQGLEVTHLSKVGGQLRMQKEVVRANVFKPTVAPPTMTLEEFADIELADAMARAEQEKLAPVADRRYEQLLAEGLEDDEELMDVAAVKDRAWDDWKEDHPKGYGNKANKRF
jgi:immunoglobulin-binding protein 1